MMKKLGFLFFCFHFIFTNNLLATHEMGGSFDYEVLDSINKIYRIRLTLYRDCSGIPMQTQITVNFASSNGCSIPSITIPAKPQPPVNMIAVEVTPLCNPKPLTTCSISSSPIKGTQRYLYEAIVQFPLGCGIVTASYTSCCRNVNAGPGSITTLSPNTSTATWLEVKINTDAKRGNNSVKLYNNPIPYICAGNPFEYNFGGYDKDGDSLVYELIKPLVGANLTSVIFQPGYSETKPVLMVDSFINFNTSNGQMRFTPTTPQVSILGMMISEYRKIKSSLGLDSIIFVGSTVTDIQFTITTACNPIQMKGINANTLQNALYIDSLTIKTCGNPGDTVKFDFKVKSNNLPIGNFLEISLDTNYYEPLRMISTFSYQAKKDSINLIDSIEGKFSFPALSNVNGSFPIRFNVSYCNNGKKIVYTYTLTVKIGSNVIPSIDISSADTFVCYNGNSNFNVVGYNLLGVSPKYKWYVNGGLADSGNSFQLKNVIKNDTVWCVMNLNLPCSSVPTVVYSDTIIVKLRASIKPEMKITPEFDTSCIGTDLKINFVSSGQGTNPKYSWYLNGVLDSIGALYKKNNFNNGDVVYCKMKSNLPCAVPDSAYSDTITINRIANLIPAVNIVADKNDTCYDTEIKITATPINGGKIPKYYWYLNNIMVDSSSNMYKKNFKDSAKVYCMIRSDLKCAVPSFAFSDTVKIKVKPLVKASITIKADTTRINAGDTATFTATSINGGMGSIYLWFVNGMLRQNSTSKIFKTNLLKNNDTVFCFINPDTACAEFPAYISNKIVMTVKALPSNIVTSYGNKWVHIYPNPFSEILTIDINASSETTTKYRILNLNGQIIESNEMSGKTKEIDLSALVEGVYYITIENNGNRITEKLVKVGN